MGGWIRGYPDPEIRRGSGLKKTISALRAKSKGGGTGPPGPSHGSTTGMLYTSNIKSDQFRFLGNCPPTHPLSQHFAVSGQ